MLRPKDVTFALIALMMGYVLVHNERFLIEPENPMWAHFCLALSVPVADVVNDWAELRRTATAPARSRVEASGRAVAAPSV